jgi:hypothetical protein
MNLRLIAMLVLALPMTMAGQQTTDAQNAVPQKPETVLPDAPLSQPRLSDFKWMEGHWVGTAAGTGRLEQYCSDNEGGVMMCMFRDMQEGKLVEMELTALRETAQGVEERVRHFDADLDPADPSELVMHVTSVSGNKIVLEPGDAHSNVFRATITRSGPDAFHEKVELVMAGGRPDSINAEWKRVVDTPAPAKK